ncbi:MAG: ABC transporter substrate-binding protein [Sulfitobacter sp.]
MTALRTKWDRRAVFASGAAAALLAATGVAAAGLPRRGGQFRLALSGAQRSDDWLRGDGLFMQVARLGVIYDALTEIAGDGTLRGELASDWRSDASGQRWAFELRRDVLFHDGAPLTAADVVSSLSQQFDIEAEGDHRLLIRLAQPDPNLPFTLAASKYVIHPAHARGAGIGTGLYQMHRFSPGQQLIAERVPHHYKGEAAGWFDRIELVSIPAEAARAQAMREYLVDAVDIEDIRAVKGAAEIQTPLKGAAVSTRLGLPFRMGSSAALDDLRAPERWWEA